MDQRFRRGFSAAEKTALWDRWQRGESLKIAVSVMLDGRRFRRKGSDILPRMRGIDVRCAPEAICCAKRI